jgi:hypothetical protein
MRWGGYVARRGAKTAYKILVGKPEEKETSREDLDVSGRVILKWIFPREVGWGGMDWIGLA